MFYSRTIFRPARRCYADFFVLTHKLLPHENLAAPESCPRPFRHTFTSCLPTLTNAYINIHHLSTLLASHIHQRTYISSRLHLVAYNIQIRTRQHHHLFTSYMASPHLHIVSHNLSHGLAPCPRRSRTGREGVLPRGKTPLPLTCPPARPGTMGSGLGDGPVTRLLLLALSLGFDVGPVGEAGVQLLLPLLPAVAIRHNHESLLTHKVLPHEPAAACCSLQQLAAACCSLLQPHHSSI